MRSSVLLVLFLISTPVSSQSSFRKLSGPEKCWVIFHPFKALKAQRVTNDVTRVVDSVRQNGVIGADGNGGKLDAFRHAYWMARLACTIGARQARNLGKAHEKGNYIQFRKGEAEDSVLPDSVSCEMDLKNNEIGISRSGMGGGSVMQALISMANEGLLYTIKKDEAGNYLDCLGRRIDMTIWKGQWGIPKCLISSKE